MIKKETNEKQSREIFSSGLAVFFATLGSAVGLGNIWKFPYLTGSNGGGAFLLVYLICILLVGIPVMVSEFYIGRKMRKNVIGALEGLKPKKPLWKIIGVFGILAGYFIMFFYSCVAGWVYSYVFKSIKGDFVGINGGSKDIVGSIFTDTISHPYAPIIWEIIVMVVVSLILIAGVKNGIEKVTKTLMPVLFVLIIICCIRSLTLPGAFEGIKFLFQVDFGKITGPIILSAVGLAFFKLSLGMGTMVTYGSYFTEDNNMINTSIRVAVSDTIVSILAGLAIFPAIFSFGMQPNGGPGLLFNSIPMVFSQIPYVGRILLIMFFVLTAIAATTAMISIVEVIVAYFTEQRGMSRTSAVILNAAIIIMVSLLVNFDDQGKGFFSTVNFNVLGQQIKGFFNIFDFLSSNILLPLGGLLIAILVGYFVDKKDVEEVLSNKGTLNNKVFIKVYRILIRTVTPLLVILVFLDQIGFFKAIGLKK